MNSTKITIISLIKNNYDSLRSTGISILNQKIKVDFEWLIIDGSNDNEILKNLKLLNKLKKEKNKYININYKNMNNFKISGIYPSMNYGLKIAKGESIIFLNCGDLFFNNKSLNIMYKKLNMLNAEKCFVFGQAQIFYSENLYWIYPGARIKNIKRWLNKFDPNHQSILVTKKLAKAYKFDENCMIIADGLWKRKIIENADAFFYINTPIITFNLDGVSNMKPNLKIAINQIKNKDISFIRKIIILIKLLIPKRLYYFYPYFQKYKNLFIEFIF